jgi:hypothetical protein
MALEPLNIRDKLNAAARKLSRNGENAFAASLHCISGDRGYNTENGTRVTVPPRASSPESRNPATGPPSKLGSALERSRRNSRSKTVARHGGTLERFPRTKQTMNECPIAQRDRHHSSGRTLDA